jgi:hypothetical protein
MLPEPHATPHCEPAQLALRSLLTESLAARLAAPDPRPLLAMLASSSVETAQVIWNSSMREELVKVGGSGGGVVVGGGRGVGGGWEGGGRGVRGGWEG